MPLHQSSITNNQLNQGFDPNFRGFYLRSCNENSKEKYCTFESDEGSSSEELIPIIRTNQQSSMKNLKLINMFTSSNGRVVRYTLRFVNSNCQKKI